MAVEARVLLFSQVISRCIKDPSVVTRLDADLVIPSDECSKIKKMYTDGDPFKANEEMITCLQKSSARGKWKSFLNALDNLEYKYLKSLLETDGKPNVNDDRGGAMIRMFTPYLESTIDAMEIVVELFSRKVINDTDFGIIRAKNQTMGNTYATIVLLERMQCRQAPAEWYYQFLDVLVHKNLKHIVEEIEPDFLRCPEQFRFCNERQRECEGNVPINESYDTEVPGCSTAGDVFEHMLTDCGEAAEEMDESVPEPLDDEENDPASSSDLKTKETNDFSISKDGLCKYTNTQNSIINETESGGTCALNKLAFQALGTRPAPEGQELSCPDSTGQNETEQTSEEEKQNDSVELEKTASVVSIEFVDTNDETGVKTESDLEHVNKDGQPLAEKLYPFQNELAEKALAGKNTIICAPTGSGKTWVATHIIDRHLKSAVKGQSKRKVVFMARNGVLVKQQMDFISKELTYANVKHIEGNTEESTMMNAFLEDYDIFLFTPQILVNNLNSDIKDLSVFSLMILDECHHARGEEPYNTLMKHYLQEKTNGVAGLPQIIGLTASIGTGRAKSEQDALDHIYRLCASLDVRCLSTVEKHKEDLAKHFSVPSEEKIVMKMRPTDPCRSILLEAVKKTADVLDDLALMEPKLITLMHKCPKDVEAKAYELWVASVINVAESLSGGEGRDIATCAKYLQVYYNALEINRLLNKKDIAVYLAKQLANENENRESLTSEEKRLFDGLKDVQRELKNVECENPNVHVISKIISNLFIGKEADANSRVMVFVHARATCRALADFLNDELEKIHVKASPLLGKETRGTDKGMTEEDQTKVLNEFKEGDYKVLVATSIGMEGLDVPDCNMTLNYNFNGNEITKIQMSGRSRKANGKEIMIGTDAQFAKDTIVMYRIKLMTEAIESFKTTDTNSINRKILEVQKKTLDGFKWQQKIKNLKRNKQSDESDYEIQCRRCGTFICNTSNLRQLDTSYLVALKDFNTKINKKAHTKRGNMGALQKKYKMNCKNCPMDWGVIGVKDGIEFFVLKLESLKFISSEEMTTNYKKWEDMPYKIKTLTVPDLDDMYNDN